MRHILFYKINYKTESEYNRAIEEKMNELELKCISLTEKRYRNKTIISYQLKQEL